MSSYTFSYVTANHTIYASFVQNNPPVYYYLYLGTDGNGYAYGSGSYQENTWAYATAYPIAPYYFWCWVTDTGTYYSSTIAFYMNGNHWGYAYFLPPW